MIRAWVCVALLFVAGAAGSCAGLAARQDMLMPIMGIAWAGVVVPEIRAAELYVDGSDVDRAAIDGAVAEVQLILDSGSVDGAEALHRLWGVLRPLAEAGVQARIDSGEIGVGVGASLLATIELFSVRLDQLLGVEVAVEGVVA